MSTCEESCATIAHEVVIAAGGTITFEEYDKAMSARTYFAPINWIAGWGNHNVLRANNDKMCAFKAVEMGLLVQTENGYLLTA